MRWLKLKRTSFPRLKAYPTMEDSVLSRIAALESANIPEKINFPGGAGLFVVDFTQNFRQTRFIPEKTLVYYVDGNTSTLASGYSLSITKSGGLTISISFDGLFTPGFILLTK